MNKDSPIFQRLVDIDWAITEFVYDCYDEDMYLSILNYWFPIFYLLSDNEIPE